MPTTFSDETRRRTAHIVPRDALAPAPATGFLPRKARQLVRRHAHESRNELPDWAYRDLLSAIETADRLERQLRQARGHVAQAAEAVRIASCAVQSAEGELVAECPGAPGPG